MTESISQRVLEYLKQTDASVSELAKELGVSRKTMKTACFRLNGGGHNGSARVRQIHVTAWQTTDTEGQDYPRPVYRAGPGKDAPRPAAKPRTVCQAHRRERRELACATNSVFSLGSFCAKKGRKGTNPQTRAPEPCPVRAANALRREKKS